MNAKDRFDACYKLAEFWSGRHDARREYEWKVALGFWAVIVAAVHYAGDIRGTIVWNRCHTMIGVVVIWGVYCTFWLFPLWSRNKQDTKQSFFYLEQATLYQAEPERVIQPIDYKDLRPGFAEFTRDWAVRFHMITTLLLLLAFWLAVTRPIEPPCGGH
jgi:hypothetical protein